MSFTLPEVDRVAKLIPKIPGKPVSIEQALEEVAEFKQVYETTPYLKDLIDTAKQMEGVVRNAGTHAAGVIITDKPLLEYVPLHPPTGNVAGDSPVRSVTQYEMSVLDSLGLLKVDFLGLATLTIMARACDLIAQRHGVELNLDNIPTNDPGTYELMGRGETAGVFQEEGSGMRRYLMQIKPKELANVIAMVALFRPGPMDFIPGYIRRMHGEEEVEYRHRLLKNIFNETYGYPVYQEQFMFAAMRLAGYTAPEADDLRKAIAKKLKDKLLTVVEEANAALLRAVAVAPELDGMGTTLVAAVFRDGHVYHAHVGDSRLYRWRGGLLEPLTRDHSLVQSLLDRGVFETREQARAAGVGNNILTGGLGVEQKVEVELGSRPVEPGDLYLLCSDGLSGMVDDAAIAEVLGESAHALDQAADQLLRLALEGGGVDNITLVLARPAAERL